MVWVVEGTLQSPPGVETETLPEVSSHWLRPVRKYRVGRAGGVRAPPKAGSDKLGAPSRARLYDFRIASLKVSKDGLIDFETGGDKWEPLFGATTSRKLDPYPLVAVVHNSKKCRLIRKNSAEPVALEPDSSGLCRMTVKDGDRFEQDQFFFELKWVPIVICFAAARADQKPAIAHFAKSAGIKVDYGEPRDDHTHYVVRKATPNKHLLSAAMRTMHVVSAAWYQDFKLVCTPPDFPSAEQLPAHPGDRQGDEDPAAYDKRWQKYEREVLALEPDAGADTARWWSHALLENDWASCYPLETEEKYFPIPFTEMDNRDKWVRSDGRKTLFRGVLVASFSGKLDNNDWQGRLLSLGGGHFFASSILQTAPLPSSASQLVDAIETYRTDAKIKSDAKVVIIPPDGLFDEVAAQRELDELSAQQKDLLLDLQEQTSATIISSSAVELAEAIASVSLDPLVNGPPRSPELRPAAPTGAPMSSIGLPDQTLPFPSGGVPGTHPDSVYPTGRSRTALTETQRSKADATQAQPSSEAGPSRAAQQQAPTQEQVQSAPKRPTKLVRRARTGHTAVLDLLEDRDEDAAARSSAPRYLTQDLGVKSSSHLAGTREASESPAVEEDDAFQPSAGASAAKPRQGRLNRRAGQQKSVLQAWLDDDDMTPVRDAETGDSGSGTSQGRAARQAKSKEERMREIREEDDRRAKQEIELHEKRKQQAEEERKAGGGRRPRAIASAGNDKAADASRQKRAKSTVTDESGSDSATSDQPARKKTSKKDGTAPVTTINKRPRAMTRAPDESSSGSERAERGGRKKSRGPPADDSAQTKKEAAARQKAAKEHEVAEHERLLQVKTSKRKGAELDKVLNEEFNALKIVKPVINPMPKPERMRLGWEEEDSDVERDRLIHADQERLEHGASDNEDEMDPNRWRQATQAMFVIKPLYLEAHERRNGNGHGAVDPKWAGTTNFKRFRPKNAAAGRPAPPERVQIQLVLPETVDYGLGEGYNDRKGVALGRAQHADQDDDNDDDDDADTFSFAGAAKGQTKLSFGAKQTANKSKNRGGSSKPKSASSSKTKAKSKRIVADSDDDSAADSSNTLNGAGMDIDELDDDNVPLQPAPLVRKGGLTSTTAAAGRSASARASSRKAAPATIMIDDSESDSDSGLTFKGFGKKGGGRL